LENLAEDKFNMTLGEIKREMPFFNEEKSISDIWDSMLKQKSQIALIIDEYGCFQGILTMEDIIETVFGLEIIDESDEVSDMQQYARERWQQRQKRHIDRTNTENTPTVRDPNNGSLA
jgi:CBS domain containing-hemolysin-like protein